MAVVYVIFAEGFEEIEGLTVVDLLRRAQIDVMMTALENDREVTGAHGIRVSMDTALKDVNLNQTRALILPGGMPGSKNLGESELLAELLKAADEKGITIGAICAAPSVLGDIGILSGKDAVCYPGFESRLKGAKVKYEAVAIDGNIITSRGMGTAIDFGLALITRFAGEEKAKEIAEAIIYD